MLGLFTVVVSQMYGASAARISGIVTDASNGEELIGALVELRDVSGASTDRTVMTERGGRFSFAGVPYGEYRIVVSFLGYRNYEKTLNVDAALVDAGQVKMEMDNTIIDAVVLEAPAMRTSQKGDTVVYNASAFKVAVDADTQSLLAKMPGIIISSDGTVEAQGEEIKKVLVDGKEFFGDDVSTAIKNLPAEVVQSVEVFNKLSDQAEFTGLDDGEGYKALNIVTSEGKRRGQFGKLYAAYGYPEYYTAGGNVNIFEGDSRISVIGLANNLNQQNFSFEDILGVVNTGGSSSSGGRMGSGGGRGIGGFLVRPMDGISTVQAVGVNYSDTWGKRDNVEVSGSYFFNHSKTRNQYTNEVWQAPGTQYDYEEGNSLSENYNHRFNARIDYKIGDNQSVMLRPWFRYQSYDAADRSQLDVGNLAGSVINPIKSVLSSSDNDASGYSGGLSALYRVRLGKQGRTLTLNLSGSYDKNDQLQLIEEYYYFPRYVEGAAVDSIANQRIRGNSYSYRIGGGATYTEPIGGKSQLSLEYRINYSYSDAEKLSYLWDPALEILNPQFSETLSTINNSGYMTQRVGPGYRFSDGKTNVSASVMYQYSTLDNNVTYPPANDPYHRYSFNNVVYFGMANVNFDQQNTLRVHLRSSTRNPSVTQLQDIPDFSGSTVVRGGNAALIPAYTHNLNAHYIRSDIGRGQTFTVMLGAQYTSDYIGDSIVTYQEGKRFVIPGSEEILQPGQRYSRYANLGGSWQLRGGLSYGLPVRFLGSNLNFNVGATLAQTPNIMDGEKFMRNESYFNGGIQLSSNISENIDFTVTYNGSYNIASGVSQGRKTEDRFVNQYASADLKWVFWKGFTFTGSASWSQYRGITSDYEEQYTLCNLYIGKKIFRNQLAEISVGVNDLFNQNTSFRRTVASSYIQNSTNLAIGRYVAVQFVYNLRNFGKGATRSASEYDNFSTGGGSVGVKSPSSGGGPVGPPHR